jgi:hypothetical protein
MEHEMDGIRSAYMEEGQYIQGLDRKNEER